MQNTNHMPYTYVLLHDIQKYIDIILTHMLHSVTCDTKLKTYLILKIN
jgi:hypothetical protein